MTELQRIQEQLRLLSRRGETRKSAAKQDLGPPPEKVEALLQRGKAIYGPDSRVESTDVADVPDRVIRAVCILVESAKLNPRADGFMLQTNSFGDEYRLCPGQRFSSQPVLGYGTGFLVTQDTVVTAGHCIEPYQVEQIFAIFDFEMGEGNDQPDLIRAPSDIYHIIKVHQVVYEVSGADYAIVTLDRPVRNVEPLPIYQGNISIKDAVYTVGHPCGLPKKVATGARVLDNSPKTHFITNLDTFGGNSGSPVLTESDEVCGILVRGEEDFVRQGNCFVATEFPLTKAGEEVCGTAIWGGLIFKRGRLGNLAEASRTDYSGSQAMPLEAPPAQEDAPSVRMCIESIAVRQAIPACSLVKRICIDMDAPVNVRPIVGDIPVECINRFLDWAQANDLLDDVMLRLESYSLGNRGW